MAILQCLKQEELGVFTEQFWFDASTKKRSDDGGFFGCLKSEDDEDDSADDSEGKRMAWLVVEIEKPMTSSVDVPGPYVIEDHEVRVIVEGCRIMLTSSTRCEWYK